MCSSASPAQRISASSSGRWRPSAIAAVEQLAEQRRDLDPLELAREARLDLPAEPFGIERFEHLGKQPGRALADPALPALARLGEEVARRAREVHLAHPPRDHRRGEEVVAQEARHRVGDAVLLLGDDRGVRDRDAERVAEQRGDREPVGQAADHRRLGEGDQA